MKLNWCTFLPVFSLWHSALAIWPIPRTLQTGTALLKLSPNFRIEVNGIPHSPQDLLEAISRTNTRLQSDKLERLVVGRGSSDQAKLVNAPSLAKLTLSLTSPTAGPVQSILEEATKAVGSRSESYSLIVPNSNSGVATIVSNSTLGLFRGLTTFEQLWYDDFSGTTYTYQAPVIISNDSPAYVCV